MQNYFNTVPLSSIQQYLRCLLRALRDIHARQIIHRDIKPANFLFDPATGQGVLVDFGLAQVGAVKACATDLTTDDFDVCIEGRSGGVDVLQSHCTHQRSSPWLPEVVFQGTHADYENDARGG